MSPYKTRRYTIVIRSHVNRRISPYTVVYDRACSTWVEPLLVTTEGGEKRCHECGTIGESQLEHRIYADIPYVTDTKRQKV
jgi:hypothetical protein